MLISRALFLQGCGMGTTYSTHRREVKFKKAFQPEELKVRYHFGDLRADVNATTLSGPIKLWEFL